MTNSIINYQLSIINLHRIDFDLLNSNPNCEIITSEPSTDYLNYYTTGTPAEGVTRVRKFTSVIYKDIYPGIDMEFITSQEQAYKYNFIVHPGGDISSIRLKIEGPKHSVSPVGTLKLKTTIGIIEEQIPHSFYRIEEQSVEIKCRFQRIGRNVFGLSADEKIPEKATLLIDPIPGRMWATYYGGIGVDYSYNLAIDHSGKVVFSGWTTSHTNIATVGAYQTTFLGNGDSFLVKFSSEGFPFWGTYFGGPGWEQGEQVSIDDTNNIYFVGRTTSTTNIATPGAFQTTLIWGEDAFLAKFDSTGSRIWSTYYGGNSLDEGMGCAVDHYGHVYLSGYTVSDSGISTPGSFQPNFSGSPGNFFDGFIAQFTAGGQRTWASYYGGPWLDIPAELATDQIGNLIVAGYTSSSTGIASPGAYQTVIGNSPLGWQIYDCFLAKFDSLGQRLWGTYYGGDKEDYINGIKVNDNGDIYFTGGTKSTINISSPGSFQQTLDGVQDILLVKFNSGGQRVWGTYFGGPGYEIGVGIAADDSNNVFITGNTSSTTSIATAGAYQSNLFGSTTSAFLAKFTQNGQRTWGTYYGDSCWGIGCATFGDTIYMSGGTSAHQSIATPGSYQPNYSDSTDIYLVKFVDCYVPDTSTLLTGPDTLCIPISSISYSCSPILFATSYTWELPPGAIIVSGQNSNSVIIDFGPSALSGYIRVRGANTCGNGEPNSFYIHTLARPLPGITGPDTSCVGELATYTSEPGKSHYAWTLSPGGTMTGGGGDADAFIHVNWINAGTQWVKLNYTDTNGCNAVDPSIYNVVVVPGDSVKVSISGSLNNGCAGTPVSYTATPTNPGTAPFYQWKVNGINTGDNNPVFTYSPVNGDVVMCVLTSSNTICTANNPTTSNTITMIVNPLLPISVSVSSSSNPVCTGTSVTLTATPTNPGPTPSYQWQVNATNAGTNSPIFTYVPMTNDQITCILTSSELCTSGNPASGNPITMTVNPLLPVGITISPSINPVCGGIPVTFTATPVNGGPSPSFQWKVNGINVGQNNPAYTYNPASGDLISCILTSSEPCATGNPASGNPIIMTVVEAPAVTFSPCFDTITTVNAKPIQLKGGIPLGGTFSGSGVSSESGGSGVLYYFNPAIAGPGIHQITYLYTNIALCSDARYVIIDTRSASPFSCGNLLMDIRDNQSYPTVQIGSQCWFASNLNYGTEIPFTTPQRDNCIPEKYTRPSSLVPRPSFYQWDELMCYTGIEEPQGLCPPGWHIPSEADWNQLFALYQGNAFAGSPLIYSGYSGFNAQVTGIAAFNRNWYLEGLATLYWSSTSHGPWKAWAHGMNEYNYSVSYYPSYRVNAFGVRCLKD
ncbi:MAG: SBBP repeat-containing protein [Bacteroidales bacterium]|nr:SBBP repeat-containing protein [Bacteroidales bacterium]